MRPIPKPLKSRFSTRLRLILLVLAVALPLAGLLIHAAHEARRSAQEQLTFQLRHFARILADDLEQSVATMQQLLGAVSRIPEIQRHQTPECSRILEAIRSQFSVYTNLYTGTASGDQACSATPFEGAINFADRDYFKKALSFREYAVGRAVRGRASGVIVLPVALGILEGDKAVGVVAASLNLGQFVQHSIRPNLMPELALTISDAECRVLARYPDNDAWAGKALPEAALFRATRNRQGADGIAEAPGQDGAARYHAFVPVTTRGMDLWVSASMPVSAVHRELQWVLWRNLGLLIIVGLVACYAAWRSG